MPEKYLFGRRPLLPLCCKKVSIVVGEPMTFDIPKLHCTAQEFVKRSYNEENLVLASSSNKSSPSGLKVEDRVSRWLYSHVADQIRIAMQDVLCRAKILKKKMESQQT
jgi:monolysocardiolipin acyltransferase